MVAYALNPLTQKAEAGRFLFVWDQPGLHSKFQNTLGCRVRPCLKNIKWIRKQGSKLPDRRTNQYLCREDQSMWLNTMSHLFNGKELLQTYSPSSRCVTQLPSSLSLFLSLPSPLLSAPSSNLLQKNFQSVHMYSNLFSPLALTSYSYLKKTKCVSHHKLRWSHLLAMKDANSPVSTPILHSLPFICPRLSFTRDWSFCASHSIFCVTRLLQNLMLLLLSPDLQASLWFFP